VSDAFARAGALLASALLATACATLAPPSVVSGERYSGKLSVRVEGDAQRSFSADFELRGSPAVGWLALSSPLGTQLARAQWSGQSVELATPERTQQFASLDAMAAEALGESVPIAALFDWLAGRPWSGAPSTAREGGFEQVGWRVDVSRHAEGFVIATRIQPPGVVVRTRLDRSS
jgi:outer membrane lipoprotein LolB